MLAAYDEVMAIILPTLGPERQATYSPFLPISERTGIVLQVPMVERDVVAGTITYLDPDTQEPVVTPVTGGRVKCQWKADWALRWAALGVDYEMAGKDLIDSVSFVVEDLQGPGCAPTGGLQL
jgi:lysyl-tRNA synthetase class 1